MENKKKAAPKKNTYRTFRRYMSGISAICMILVIVASTLSGASVGEVVWRTFKIWSALFVIQWILIKTWSTYEITKGTESTIHSAPNK